ncbi:hypothetical protein KXW36_009821, partial [Aspergillus fumigatus]
PPQHPEIGMRIEKTCGVIKLCDGRNGHGKGLIDRPLMSEKPKAAKCGKHGCPAPDPLMAGARINLFLLAIDPDGGCCQHPPLGEGMIAWIGPTTMTHPIAAPGRQGQPSLLKLSHQILDQIGNHLSDGLGRTDGFEQGALGRWHLKTGDRDDGLCHHAAGLIEPYYGREAEAPGQRAARHRIEIVDPFEAEARCCCKYL